MSKLYSSIKIKDTLIKNRIVMAPMCMYSASEDGIATQFHLTHYLTRAIGGVGMVIVEATAIEPRGRISINDLGLWDDNQIPMLKKIVDEVHKYNTTIGIQLNHAGRKARTNEKNIAPSIVQESGFEDVIEMDKDAIINTIKLFKDAALRAYKAGFDFIEIHGAHGYLINQFLSPLANKRTDEYGGNINNRARFLIEIVDAIKEVFPKTLGLRVSAEEYHQDGNHPEDLVKIINFVRDKLDFIDVSSGGVIAVPINAYPGYQLNFARIIKDNTLLPTIGGGLITTPQMAENAINNEDVDLVFFGRELLRNPYFALNAAKELNTDIEWPTPYKRGKI
ncbi:MAG TPA: NADPH dehydrogenase NamA [Acholeplasmataceae bacterium]|jgi:NADPH2 dehydrogenase|nr:NADPH dehydrogenase NamA [Acholeplasmataceae bacterium]